MIVEETTKLKDSGVRREFESGAVRDISEGKGRCDLLPFGTIASVLEEYVGRSTEKCIFLLLEKFKQTKNMDYIRSIITEFCDKYYDNIYTGFLEVSKQYEDGAKKYSANNWKRGIPVHCYIDSAARHYLKFLRGDTDEPHDRAFIWNMLGAMWTIENKPELNDIEN